MKKFLLLLVLIIISCGDEDTYDYHSQVTIVNNSAKTIYFGGRTTTEAITYNPLTGWPYYRLLPGEIHADIDGRERGRGYEELFWENNVLYYTLYDEEVLLNNSWDYIRENNLFLKRYRFTLEEMIAANWVIIYTEN